MGPQRAVASVRSALVLGLLVTLASYFLYTICRAISGSGWKSLAWTSVTVLFFWNWSGIELGSAIPAWLVSSVLFAITVIGVGRMADNRYFRIGALMASVTISSTLLLILIRDELTTPAPVVAAFDRPSFSPMTSKPDVIFILLDGYARADVLGSLYNFDNSTFLRALENEGFTVPSSSNSNYPTTHFSLSSVLEMSYMAPADVILSNSDLRLLARTISGDNLLVKTLKANGYTYVHGDTDHWLNRCGSEVDLCIPGPLIDITADALLSGTPIGPFMFPTSGDPTTALNLKRLEQLRNWDEFSATFPEGPNLIFLHLVLPHPPLFLDASCTPRVEADLDGRTVSDGTMPEEQVEKRRHAYVEQIECANHAIMDFLSEVDPTAAIVITADHGPDSLNPMNGDPDEWTETQIHERMAAFFSMRIPTKCAKGPFDDHQLVNTFRVVVGCLTSSDPETLDGRWFAASYGGHVVELKNPDLNAE